MDKRDNVIFNNGSALLKESDTNKSFVKKVQSRVSGLLSTSLSKWFGGDNGQKPTTRHRSDDDDDDEYTIQPPSKRIKIPATEPAYENSLSNTHCTDVNNRISSYSNNAKTLFEPVAGPSGHQTNLLNGDKESESGESTDGYSSRLRLNHTDTTESRHRFNVTSPSTSHNRSLFSDHSSTQQLNTSLSSRRPSFNASTFGSPNFIDRTLSTKRILNSPFYKGRTIYGGASAYSAQSRNAAERQSIRKHVQVKPVNNSTGNDATLSETARRILQALEEFRSPLSDAQKVPPPTRKQRPEGILSKYTGANPYVKDHKIPLALNKELQVPTVPDLLKMKLKERLQDSTVAVRQIATTSKSVLNKDDYKLRNEDETPKHSNKIKNKITATRQQKPDNPVEEVKLPEIALPITTLPKFDFSLPPPPSSTKQLLVTVACNEPAKVETAQNKPEVPTRTDTDNVQYKFSNPLILAENLISIIAINDFKFSDPVVKQKDVNFKSNSDNSFQLKRKIPSEVPQPAVKLYKGSIDDVFNKQVPDKSLDKFKPAPETWECSVCLIRNVPEKLKCVACENPKAQKTEVQKPSFGDEFKMGWDKWECSVCMVRNSNNDSKCVACSNLKPVKDGKLLASSFGDKFKPADNVWICPTCMIQNKKELEKCAACETQQPGFKPNGFGEAFKMKTNEWECSVCMIRNPNEKETCVACETPKPGSKPSAPKVEKQETIPTFNFGIVPTTKTVSKVAEIATKPTVTPAPSNETATVSAIPAFTFGIPQKEPAKPATTIPAPTILPASQPAKPIPEFKPPVVSSKPENEASAKGKTEEPVQSEPAKLNSGPFTFGDFAKPNSEVRSPPKSVSFATSKPIITSPNRSAFATTSAPSLKRNLTDADSTTTEAKKEAVASLPSTIIFSPPKVDVLKPPVSTPQLNMLNQEKNLFSVVPKTQAVTTQTPTLPNPSFSFTAPQAQTQATPALPVNLFNFAAKTTPSLFGNTTTTTTQQAPLFKFNQPETSNGQPTFGVPTETPPSVFGKPGASIFGVAPKPTFEAPTPAPAPAFGGFGAEIKQNVASGFGGEIKPQAAISGFGTDIKQPMVAPAFGNEMKAPTFGSADVKPFTFGARPNEEPAKPVFSFGAAVVKPQEPAKPIGFSFGTPPSQPAQPPAGGFSFSNNNNNAANPAPTFNFASPKVETNLPFQQPPAAANIFNAPLQPPNQGMPNGGFNFGSAPSQNNNMKTGFNFGGNNQFNATPAAPAPAGPPVFSFGSNPNPAPTPAAGGFNFGQTAPTASAFNANTKPNFNFTAGNLPTTFSATSDNSSMVQRRRLKAVRRNQR